MAQNDSIVLALAGDAMLGRRVADAFASASSPPFFSAEIAETLRDADLFVLNLECCISSRGEPWTAPDKPFFFRAPPAAANMLASLGVDCVTLANNHALDFGVDALCDTLEHLAAAGVRCVGAGVNETAARTPVVLEANGFRLGVVAATDHPADYAAAIDRPGVAFADLRSGTVPEWLCAAIDDARTRADAVLFTPHWGPNLTPRPPPHVREAATKIGPGVTLIAGHSAHVFHGVGNNVLFDLGDLLNDYASVRPPRNVLAGIVAKLRREIGSLGSEIGVSASGVTNHNDTGMPVSLWQLQQRRARRIASMIRARTMRPDLGLLFLVTLDRGGLRRLEALPIKIGHCHTALATGHEAAFAHRRFGRACGALGTKSTVCEGRSVIVWR